MDKLDLTLHTLLKKASEKAPDPMPKDASDAVLHTLTSLPDTPPILKSAKLQKYAKSLPPLPRQQLFLWHYPI